MSPKMLYVAPLRDFSGYATAARNYVYALDSVGADIVTRSLYYDGGDRPLSKKDKELEQRRLNDIDIIIQHTTPNETERKDGVFNVIYFAWETDVVPSEWVDKINQMDLALVPCDANIKAARLGGVKIPIEKVHHTFDKSYYDCNEKFILPFDTSSKFKLLSICQLSKKKGVDALLKAYFTEFQGHDDVLLILKVYIGGNDTEQEKQRFLQIVESVKQSTRLTNFPKLYVIHTVLEEEAIKKLYKTADCYVLPSRGEGWGIPHFDAMGFGLPSIGVGWGGPPEFLTDDAGWLVDYKLTPCSDMPHPHPFMYTSDSRWAEPDISDLCSKMRSAYQEWKVFNLNFSDNCMWKRRIESAKRRVDDFSYEKVGTHMRDVIYKYYDMWRKNES